MMNFIMLSALLLSTVDAQLTIAQITKVKNDIKTFFGLTPSYGLACDAKAAPCPAGDNIGAIVRLAFHDSAGSGGPNGCIDFKEPANNGLQAVVASLNSLYASGDYSSLGLSRADFWVLASNAAIEQASTPATSGTLATPRLDTSPGTLTLPFRYGRTDAATCNDIGLLPAASNKLAATSQLFMGRYGMTIQETVAILGAHSVGRCEFANSGFDGGWTTAQSSFSNQYYKVFGQVPWANNNASAIWTRGATQILLESDVEILYNSFPNTVFSRANPNSYCSRFNNFASTAAPACPFQTTTSQIMIAYANDISLFYSTFSTAYQKMTELGNTALFTPVIPTASPVQNPTAAPSKAPVTIQTQAPSNAPVLAPVSTPTKAPVVSTKTAAPTPFPQGGRPGGPGGGGNRGPGSGPPRLR